MKALLLIAILIAVCAAAIYAAINIEPSVPVSRLDDPINSQTNR